MNILIKFKHIIKIVGRRPMLYLYINICIEYTYSCLNIKKFSSLKLGLVRADLLAETSILTAFF